MTYYLLIVLFASGTSGFFVGLCFRGRIPLRSPSNKVRLDNSKTDLKLLENRVSEAEKRNELVKLDGEQRMMELRIEEALEQERKKIQFELTELEQKALSTTADFGGEPISDIIRKQRIRLGMTQVSMADKACIPLHRYRDIELGKRYPDQQEIFPITRILNFTYIPAKLVPKPKPSSVEMEVSRY